MTQNQSTEDIIKQMVELTKNLVEKVGESREVSSSEEFMEMLKAHIKAARESHDEEQQQKHKEAFEGTMKMLNEAYASGKLKAIAVFPVIDDLDGDGETGVHVNVNISSRKDAGLIIGAMVNVLENLKDSL